MIDIIKADGGREWEQISAMRCRAAETKKEMEHTLHGLSAAPRG